MSSKQWSDPDYLRTVQYRDATNLVARANIHRKYATSRQGWFPWLAAQVDWPENGRILDVGCGPGWFWAHSGASFPDSMRLTLVDLSVSMSEEASARVSAAGQFARVESLTADVQALPFDDGTFDVVVANHMLYHASSPGAAVAEISRVVRAEGCLLAATNGPDNFREVRDVAVAVFGSNGEDTATSPFDSQSGWAVLESRFEDVEWNGYEDSLECTSVDDLVAYVLSTPARERATDAQVEELTIRFQERLDAGLGIFSVSKETGAFVARTPFLSV